MKRKIYCLLGGAVLLGSAVIAQPQKNTRKVAQVAQPQATQPKANGAYPEGTVLINNPGGTTTWLDEQQVGIMKKDVTVSQVGEDFILYCDELTYNRKTEKAVAKINVRVDSRDSTITGTTIYADFRAKTITVVGNVVMNSHGTNDGIRGTAPNRNANRRRLPKQVEGKASTMKCERVVFNYKNREAEITGNINMIQADRSGTCEKIIYDETNNIAKLIGKVRFVDGEGQVFETPNEIVIWIDKDVMSAGPGNITIPRKEEDRVAGPPKTAFPNAPTVEIDPETQKILNETTPTTPNTKPQGGNNGGKSTPETPPADTDGQNPEKEDTKPADNKPPASSPVDQEKTSNDTDKSKTKTAQRDG